MEMEKTDELLGEGHYGKVYLTTHQDYVVKVIQDNPKTVASAQAECQAHLIWKMPTLEGDPPGVEHPNLEPERAVVIANSLLQQLIPALVHMAQRNVIHRDIKPENILFEDAEGGGYNFYLSDFGLVKDLSLGSAHSPRRGATGFIAPEMRDPSLGPQSSGLDYWSLFAVALYVVDNVFRTEVDTFDKKTDPSKSSMKFPRLVAERIDYWLARRNDNGVGNFIAKTCVLAGPDPQTRIDTGLMLWLNYPRTFLEDTRVRLEGAWHQVTGLQGTWAEGTWNEDTDAGGMVRALEAWMSQRPESPSNLIPRYVTDGKYTKAIPLLRQRMMAPGNHEASLDRMSSTYEVAAAYLASNQVHRAIEVLEFLVKSELEHAKVPVAHAFRRNSERTLAVAYLLASMNLEGRRMKEAIGLVLPKPTTRYSRGLDESFGGWGVSLWDGDTDLDVQEREVRRKVELQDGLGWWQKWVQLFRDRSVENELTQKAIRLLERVVNVEAEILAEEDESRLLSQALIRFALALESGRMTYCE